MPKLLELYCNIIEVCRIRNEIILAASECMVLKQIYEKQCQKCNLNLSVDLGDSISFPGVDEFENDSFKQIDFVNDGPAAHLDIDLAVKDFDKMLLSNINFRSPDAIVLNMFRSGLEELRAVL